MSSPRRHRQGPRPRELCSCSLHPRGCTSQSMLPGLGPRRALAARRPQRRTRAPRQLRKALRTTRGSEPPRPRSLAGGRSGEPLLRRVRGCPHYSLNLQRGTLPDCYWRSSRRGSGPLPTPLEWYTTPPRRTSFPPAPPGRPPQRAPPLSQTPSRRQAGACGAAVGGGAPSGGRRLPPPPPRAPRPARRPSCPTGVRRAHPPPPPPALPEVGWGGPTSPRLPPPQQTF